MNVKYAHEEKKWQIYNAFPQILMPLATQGNSCELPIRKTAFKCLENEDSRRELMFSEHEIQKVVSFSHPNQI